MRRNRAHQLLFAILAFVVALAGPTTALAHGVAHGVPRDQVAGDCGGRTATQRGDTRRVVASASDHAADHAALHGRSCARCSDSMALFLPVVRLLVAHDERQAVLTAVATAQPEFQLLPPNQSRAPPRA